MASERYNSSRLVLIVEDNDFLAIDLELTLASHGYSSLLASSVRMALVHMAEHRLDGALLDVSLSDGESVFSVADALTAAHIPFVFLTGRSSRHLPERFRSVPLLSKPYDLASLLSALNAAFTTAQDGSGGLDR